MQSQSHTRSSPEELLLYRLGPPRVAGEERCYVAVCRHGETLHSLWDESDDVALARMLATLRNPLVCDERTLWDAARASGLAAKAPCELQRYELAVQSARLDLEPQTCTLPPRCFSDFLLASTLLSGIRAWEDPPLQQRFFRMRAA